MPLTSESGGGMNAALSVTMPTARTDAGWPGSVLRPLGAAAQEIRALLGVREPNLVIPAAVGASAPGPAAARTA